MNLLALKPRSAPTPRPLGALALALLVAGAAAAAGCDGGAPVADAAAPPSARTSALSLRIDTAGGRASLSALAFRAAFSGVAAVDVLGLVDPLAVAAPARDCQLRDVDRAAAELVARGDAIELEELEGAGFVLSDATPAIRLSPRLYPDLAATIGGVVGEAGPLGLGSVPQQIKVTAGVAANRPGESADAALIAVPAAGSVKLLNGAMPHDGILVDVASDLNLSIASGAVAATPGSDTETSLELRPFGATVALSCAIPPEALATAAGAPAGTFVVSHQAVAALVTSSGATPGAPVAAGLDLVRRVRQQLPLSEARVAVEVRTSLFVELRP